MCRPTLRQQAFGLACKSTHLEQVKYFYHYMCSDNTLFKLVSSIPNPFLFKMFEHWIIIQYNCVSQIGRVKSFRRKALPRSCRSSRMSFLLRAALRSWSAELVLSQTRSSSGTRMAKSWRMLSSTAMFLKTQTLWHSWCRDGVLADLGKYNLTIKNPFGQTQGSACILVEGMYRLLALAGICCFYSSQWGMNLNFVNLAWLKKWIKNLEG